MRLWIRHLRGKVMLYQFWVSLSIGWPGWKRLKSKPITDEEFSEFCRQHNIVMFIPKG